ncbi:MAG: glycosyltransferase family 2 protein [Candidatus Omnitrophica bacterium]|nr:glycosyltransferase family 2 protein [Candidatus Omnitrophota bacterium]
MIRVCVVIPAYNEAVTIGSVIAQVKQLGIDVILVDDGSVDETARIGEDLDALVLRNELNQGKGMSLGRGIKYALERDFDFIITMDGDGQHHPDNIPLFLNYAKKSSATLFVGNRMPNPIRMPKIRLLTNKIMSWFISKIVGQKIPDSQCGFRLLKKDLARKLRFTTRRFEVESETLVQAVRLGHKVESVPIRSIYYKEKSRINPFVDTIRFIRFIWQQIIKNSNHGL